MWTEDSAKMMVLLIIITAIIVIGSIFKFIIWPIIEQAMK